MLSLRRYCLAANARLLYVGHSIASENCYRAASIVQLPSSARYHSVGVLACDRSARSTPGGSHSAALGLSCYRKPGLYLHAAIAWLYTRLLSLGCQRSAANACPLTLGCYRSAASPASGSALAALPATRLLSLGCYRSHPNARLLSLACQRSAAIARLLSTGRYDSAAVWLLSPGLYLQAAIAWLLSLGFYLDRSAAMTRGAPFAPRKPGSAFAAFPARRRRRPG